MNEFINEIADLSRQIYDYGRNNDKEVIAANANYYERAVQSPSVARLVYKDTFHKCDKEYQQLVREGKETLSEFTAKTFKATQNALMATNDEPAASAYESFVNVVDRIYKNSEWIREFSVDTNRIVLDKVKGKAGLWHKFKVGMFMKKHGIKSFFK